MRLFFFYFLFSFLMIFSASDAYARREKESFEYEINQNGGCQSFKAKKPQVQIEFLPPDVEFNKTINDEEYSLETDKEIEKWYAERQLSTYWVPEGHIEGGVSSVTGLGYEVTTTQYSEYIDQAAKLACAYFDKVLLKINMSTLVMYAKSIADNNCQYLLYTNHLKEHSDIEKEIVSAMVENLKAKDIYDVIAFGEGDEYVMNQDRELKNLKNRQNSNLVRGLDAYMQFIANEAEYKSSRLDLGNEILEFQNEIKSCK